MKLQKSEKETRKVAKNTYYVNQYTWNQISGALKSNEIEFSAVKSALDKLINFACGELTQEKTAWQWLSREWRYPNADAVPVKREKRYPVDIYNNEWDSSYWYYYRKKDTHIVTEEEYFKLKNAYVEKFGGWEKIDLKHTTYNGKAWT